MIDVMNINVNYIFMYYDPRFRDLKPSKQSLTILEVSKKRCAWTDAEGFKRLLLKTLVSSFLRVDF